jgi:hypothetical protein
MKLDDAIEICEDLFASEDGSSRAKALRVVLTNLHDLRMATATIEQPASSISAWRDPECEHEELPADTPYTVLRAMVRRREADGWKLHPVTEYDGRMKTYIFTRPKR